jgi:hypothetical protein
MKSLYQMIHLPSVITERTAFWPRDGYAEDWEQAGEEIGRHDYLEKLNFTTFTLSAAVTDALMRGVATNRSIRTLEFIWCNGMWGRNFDILAAFIENNSKLHEINVSLSETFKREIRSLSSTFRRLRLEVAR